jgi:hypothetical protein
MHSYELVFSDQREDAVQRLQFEAEDTSAALRIAHQQSGTRPLDLWQDGKKLCELRRHPVGSEEVWIVSGSHAK